MASPVSSLRVLVISGSCPIAIHPALEKELAGCLVTIVGAGQQLPTDFYDIEVVDTHLSAEEWSRLWNLKRARQPNQRIHVCLAQPVSALVCRNVLEEYRRRIS
jgi:hypothetical protein